MTKQADVERVVSATEEVFGSVDVLVNNSGRRGGAERDALREVRVGSRRQRVGIFLMAQAVGRYMIERGSGGTIINVAPIAALVGVVPDYMQTFGYNSSKGTVVSMIRDLATS